MKKPRSLERRVLSHWAWSLLFAVYFVVSAIYYDSAWLGIGAGLYTALVIFHLKAIWDEREEQL